MIGNPELAFLLVAHKMCLPCSRQFYLYLASSIMSLRMLLLDSLLLMMSFDSSSTLTEPGHLSLLS